jgi:hypothetical protein
MLQAGMSVVRFRVWSLDFSIEINLTPPGPGADSASVKNEYQESSCGKWRPAPKADNLTAICEPIVYKIWEPRRVTAHYRGSFILSFFTRASRQGITF